MRIDIKTQEECCGCTACANICPTKAITMQKDSLGFYYPKIEDKLCINCGACTKHCQFHSDYNRYDNYNVPVIYGGRLRDTKALSQCQSGGASEALIKAFLSFPGIVYGVALEKDNIHVVHKRATNINNCKQFRGSKYVQSDLTNIFNNVKEDLKNGERVLFFGTGCQVAGLKAYLPVYLHKNLTCIDIVCHASPSPALWESYIQFISNKYGDTVEHADFRDKSYGWFSFNESFILKHKKGKIKRGSFIFLFFKHLSVRKSCANCPYTNINRVGDITIGDFWGWKKFHSEWNDDKGVSLCMINSNKGERLFSETKDYFIAIESRIEECLQPQLMHPCKLHPKRDEFEKDFSEHGFLYVAKKYGDLSLLERIKKILRPIYNKFKRKK